LSFPTSFKRKQYECEEKNLEANLDAFTTTKDKVQRRIPLRRDSKRVLRRPNSINPLTMILFNSPTEFEGWQSTSNFPPFSVLTANFILMLCPVLSARRFRYDAGTRSINRGKGERGNEWDMHTPPWPLLGREKQTHGGRTLRNVIVPSLGSSVPLFDGPSNLSLKSIRGKRNKMGPTYPTR